MNKIMSSCKSIDILKHVRKKVRGQTKCRFGAPWPPMRNTAILRPLDSEHLQHQINYKHVYQQIQNQLTQKNLKMAI